MELLSTVAVVADGDESTAFIKKSKESLNLLISTPAGTVPLDREFGLDQSFLSLPPETVKTLLAQEIIEKAAIYIPEITIADIKFSVNSSGSVFSTITIARNTEYTDSEDTDEDLSTDEDEYYYDSEDPDADEEESEEE